MTSNNLSAMSNRQLWFSVGNNFNDPFDCTLNVPINLMTGASMLNFIKEKTNASFYKSMGLINDEHINNIVSKHLYNAQRLVDEGNVEEHPINTILQYTLASLRRSFVCCFSKNATNHLLWSHYANSHTGYCIRYKYESLLKDIKLRRHGNVIYDDSPVDLLSVFTDETNIALDIIYRKSLCWQYEDEVRFVHYDISERDDDNNKVCTHSDDAIDCVILGYKFDMSRLGELKSAMKNANVLFKKIERSPNSYKLYVSPERF